MPLLSSVISPRLAGRESIKSDLHVFHSPNRAYQAVVEYESGNSEFVPFQRFELQKAGGSSVYARQGDGHTVLDISDQGLVVGIDFDGPVSGRARLHFYDRTGQKTGSAEVGFLAQRAFSADGSVYGVLDSRNGVRLFQVDGTELGNLGQANRFALSGNGRSVALAQDEAVVLFQDGREAGRYPLASPFVRDISLSGNGAVLAWVDRFKLYVLRTEAMQLTARVSAPEPALRFISVDVSEDGRQVAVGLDADAGRGTDGRHRRGLVMLLDPVGTVLWQEQLSYDKWNITSPQVRFSGSNALTVRTAEHVLRYEYQEE